MSAVQYTQKATHLRSCCSSGRSEKHVVLNPTQKGFDPVEGHLGDVLVVLNPTSVVLNPHDVSQH